MMIRPIIYLIISNCFMTYAWYGHLKDLRDKPLWMAIILSWLVASLEYCFQVPANRLGFKVYSLAQLKVIQEIITMTIFSGFAIYYMRVPLTRNLFFASLCLVAAAFFIFRDGIQNP